MIGRFISRALEEQKLNARGVMPRARRRQDADLPLRRPAHREREGQASLGASVLPTARVAKETGYVCYQLENNSWRRKRTHDPGSRGRLHDLGDEDHAQAELLCEAYEDRTATGGG